MDALMGTGKMSPKEFHVVAHRNISVCMSDGVDIDVDIFRPDSSARFPVLLSIASFNKEYQSARIWPAPTRTRRIRGMADACLETPLADFWVCRGYVLIIGSVRGTGRSGGYYQFLSQREIQDTYELIEWAARQSWCSGQVGMLGQGYYSAHQSYVAQMSPPHLKALAPIGTFWDNYRHFWWPGGVLQKGFLRWLVSLVNMDIQNEKSALMEKLGEKKYRALIAQALVDKDLQGAPEIVEALQNPFKLGNANYLDIVLQPLINDYWRARGADIDFTKFKIPAYLGGVSHRPSVFYYWPDLKIPKKLILFPPSYTDRPFYQLSWELLRWFDTWLKDIDTGIMDEPAVKLFVSGSNDWLLASDFPVPGTRWTPFHLHENRSLLEYEPWPDEASASYDDAPGNRGSLVYTSAALVENTEIAGPVNLSLSASCRGVDTNFFVGLWDVESEEKKVCLTRGYLKASHRALDSRLSKPWLPVPAHTDPQPLVPGRVYRFSFVMNPTAHLFKAGHRIMLKISSADDVPENLYQVGHEHLCSQTPNTITIYHDADHPSSITLPVTKGDYIGTFSSGGDISLKTQEYMKNQ
jgi:uncharacterized protein